MVASFFTIIVFSIIAGGISIILSVEEKMANNIHKNTYRIHMNQTDTESNFTNDNLLSWLHKEQNKTVLIVTHDEKIAKQCEGIINVVDGKIV